ncbi:MAG: gas vesicle protein [Longimicrobiales bacterium]
MTEAEGSGGITPLEPQEIDADLEQELTLVELVNRVLDRGVFLRGEVAISVAGIDLVYLGLQVLLSSIETMEAQYRPGRSDVDDGG